MLPNRFAFVALAVACLAAAGGGGYLAMRQNAVPAVTQASSPAPSAAVQPQSSADATVLEKETPGGNASLKAESLPPSEVVITSAQPVKKAEPPARPSSSTQASSRPARSSSAAARNPEPAPTPERTWQAPPPIPSTSQPQVPAPAAQADQLPPARPDDRVVQETPEPPEKAFEELVVVADSVIGLQASTTVTSERARVEDRVEARVTRDVRVHDMVAIPAGSRALGTVVSVERGGRFKERARLGVRFNTLVLADGTRLPITTDTIYREGDAPGKDSTAKMTGAAVGGAILGAILGGGKGAAIGGAVGAGAGAAGVMAADKSQAALYSGEQITVRLLSPVTVTIEPK
jgi:hypothetical protein